jgi:hypothetical protein
MKATMMITFWSALLGQTGLRLTRQDMPIASLVLGGLAVVCVCALFALLIFKRAR